MRRTFLLLLTATCSLYAFGTDYSFARQDQNRKPDLYVQFDALSFGGGVKRPYSDSARPFEATVIVTLAYFGLEFHHVRAGFGLLDAGYFGTISFLPMSVGYTVYEKPVRQWGRLYGMEPEVYLRATTRFDNGLDHPPYIPFVGTLEAVCLGSYFGVGLSAEAGIVYAVDEGYPNAWPRKRYIYPYLAAQVHFPHLLLGF